MQILIKSATILDVRSPHHHKQRDVLVVDGVIKDIKAKIEPGKAKTIDGRGAYLSIGWFDMRATFSDPGFEHKEDLYTGSEAAAAGGFTGVALLPNNNPVTQSKNDVAYINTAHTDFPVDLHAIAAVTLGAKGEELTEMIDLHHAGAVAFSDGANPIWHTDILLKTLQYLQKFDGLLIDKPEDKFLNSSGVMNEGISSTALGMKGMPALAEELIVQRNLEVLKYTGGRLHISNISSAKSVALIREAKKQGLKVTCDMASYQTAFDDSALDTFDTAYKVNPPFRTAEDNKALIKALKDGTIDVIVSNHTPHDEESKKLEFDLADFGITSIQTVAHNLAQLQEKVELATLVEKVTVAPRELLGLPVPDLEAGSHANLTLFDPSSEWTLNNATNKSKAVNSPYWQQPLAGRALAVVNGTAYYSAE